MSIDFQKTFGAGSSNVGSGQKQDADRPKAQFWLNVGYVSDREEEDGSRRFISLPTGIPLDTQEKLPVNSRNEDFAAFQAARNDLLDQFSAVAQKLAPGEERIIGLGDSGLAVQIRRVNEEREAIAPEHNTFVKKLALVG